MERSRHAKLQRRTGGGADLLSQFDFNIINEGPGDFSTQHRKYTCEFSKPGIESFTTTYQSNPDVHGQPTATDVFAALASDALAVDGLFVDTFADELGFEKPSQAIRAYESCHKTLDWLKNDMQLTTSEISDIAETLDNELDEVKEEVERVQAERKAKHEFEHPPVPEGFTSIEDLQARLDLGEYGDQIMEKHGNIGDAFGEIADSNVDLSNYDLLEWLPDNYEWLEEADFQGLLEGCEGDLIKMTQMAQYECFTQDMYNHQEDIAKYAALEGLKEAGVYALADDVYDDVFDGITIDFDDNNMDIEDFASEAQNAIHDAMDEPLYDALGSNDGILEDGELSGDFEAIKESGYDFPNPCAMSIEAVLVGNYDLTDSDSDYYISDDLLNELLSRHGYPSMDALKESQADMWRNELTAIIAEAQEDSRFEVPFHLSSDESMLRHIVKRMGVPEEAARTAVANARAMYEKDAPRREPEKVVTLKGEVDKARRASAKLADNGNHSNRGQDAR